MLALRFPAMSIPYLGQKKVRFFLPQTHRSKDTPTLPYTTLPHVHFRASERKKKLRILLSRFSARHSSVAQREIGDSNLISISVVGKVGEAKSLGSFLASFRMG